MFQFTHPGRGATTYTAPRVRKVPVSIHAPREGCDANVEGEAICSPCFNSRTPGGVRPPPTALFAPQLRFQFTHPGRGATPSSVMFGCRRSGFNSRTPGGVRHEADIASTEASTVSIHAPREGCDLSAKSAYLVSGAVSIHAPREGCDSVVQSCVL